MGRALEDPFRRQRNPPRPIYFEVPAGFAVVLEAGFTSLVVLVAFFFTDFL